MLDAGRTAQTVNLTFQRGHDWSFPIRKTNDPVSMSGWTFTMEHAEDEGGAAVEPWTADTSGASSGAVDMTLAASARGDDPTGDYWYRCNVDRNDGNGVQPFCRGALTVELGQP